jgi:malate dehydrogenase (oxaloacetate-decarboxylating)(NADP+)
VTRSFGTTFDEVTRVLDANPRERVFGLSIFLSRTRTVFIADTTVHELPTPEELADIAIQTARKARQFGHEPRVALLSFSNFGNPLREKAERVRLAVNELDERKVSSRREVDFEFDGEMQADVALSYDLMQARYPFCRLSGAANVLIMPALHSANISAKLLQHLGGGTVIPDPHGLSAGADRADRRHGLRLVTVRAPRGVRCDEVRARVPRSEAKPLNDFGPHGR